MRSLALSLLLAATPTLVPSTPALAQRDELVLSECSVLPEYDPAAMRYIDRGPSLYGSWLYEVVYRWNRTVLLLDRFGNVRCDEPLVRSELRTQRFELNEQFGNASEVARDVKAWLAGRAVERCPQ